MARGSGGQSRNSGSGSTILVDVASALEWGLTIQRVTLAGDQIAAVVLGKEIAVAIAVAVAAGTQSAFGLARVTHLSKDS